MSRKDNYTAINSSCFRVLRKGGVLLAGMDNGMNFLFDDNGKLPLTVVNKLPFNPLKNASEEEYRRMVDNFEGIQFSHTLEEQLGGQLVDESTRQCARIIAFSKKNRITFFGVSEASDFKSAGLKLIDIVLEQLDTSKYC